MKYGISLSIDVTKIDKSKIIDGKKGKYVNMTMFVDTDEQDQYGNNGAVTQSVTKEEKEQGVKGLILGNAKIFWSGNSQGAKPKQQTNQTAQQDTFDDFDVPF